ncbi:MAG: asparagine synthase (glutamine-hydrolyzing), partial [Deltaproteobacteria bacterium]|nr:asparagine synthase (glutamine-hydrolyzing) [Deltaproteobacteria bacterium]
RLTGMFALALWDTQKRTLLLARDRLGIKPLFYAQNLGALAFASELKALMTLPGFSRQVDLQSLAKFLHWQYVPAPATIFKDCLKLLPGEKLTLGPRGVRISRWWEPPRGAMHQEERGEEDLADELDALVSRAVSERLVSDVPLGALLSGGVDSSLVAAAMQKAGQKAKTFTIGFAEQEYDEAPRARKVADALGTDHTELYVEPGHALEVVPRLPVIYDEPFGDPSAIPTFLVSRLARERVTVALSGDGGDELFGGYVRYWAVDAANRALLRLPAPARRAAGVALSRLPPGLVDAVYRPLARFLPQRFSVTGLPDKVDKLATVLRKGGVEELYRMSVCVWTADQVRDLVGLSPEPGVYEESFFRSRGASALCSMMQADLSTYLPDDLLAKVDRASMASGLEVRVPLLDHRVVAFSAGVPDHFKVRGGTGKHLLKKVLARYLPPELCDGPKKGFEAPLAAWLRGELKPLMLDLLSPSALKREGVLRPEAVGRCVDAHLSGREDHRHRLWVLMMWEMWRREWLG